MGSPRFDRKRIVEHRYYSDMLGNTYAPLKPFVIQGGWVFLHSRCAPRADGFLRSPGTLGWMDRCAGDKSVVLLSVHICPYLSTSIHIYPSTSIHICPHLSAPVRPHLSTSVHIYPHLSLIKPIQTNTFLVDKCGHIWTDMDR